MRLIDADKLKEHYSWWHDMEDVYTNNSLQQDAEDLDVIIDVQPTVDPVQHGRWERHYSRPNVYADMFWHCSECGYRTANQWANKYYKYCPSCGTQMDEVEQDEID